MKGVLLISLAVLLIATTVSSGPVTSSSAVKKAKQDKEPTKTEPAEENDNIVTEEEKQFLKEIEEKYNVKKDDDIIENTKSKTKKVSQQPLPAVIAIEIVNDNATDGKGKRTIDANLGYGYKTNNGYIYSQFGKPEEKGKFMIYPYSQHDIPPTNQYTKYTKTIYTNKLNGEKTQVEIQPSKAYQLVPIDSNEQDTTNYGTTGGISHIRTKYEHVQGVETPPPPPYNPEDYYSQQEGPTTLYSTYSGGQISGLSGHFPAVMPNYFVSPSQILSHPQYQSLGLQENEQEHLPHRNVIPVLILRIPSSHIQNPTATFYPKLPHTNPYAMSLNNINLQSIVKQYLANLQPQYSAPSSEEKYVPTYNQPSNNYYQPQQPVYSVPSINEVQYSQSETPQYLPPSQPTYLHQVSNEEHQPNYQSIKYVIPHPSSSSKTQGPISHASFSQIYSNPHTNQESIQYENSDEQAQSLPISENYPDTDHTRVILSPPQYQSTEQSYVHSPQSQAVTYVTPSPVTIMKHSYRVLGHSQPTIRVMHQHYAQPLEQQDGISDSYGNRPISSHEEDDHGYQPSPSKIPPMAPYNFHAHPFPKRQIKSSDMEPRKISNRNRRLLTGVHTATKVV